jgi:glyoxylase-like metal-dependent hydrolase (beta-lactamase superfamily II)
MLYDEHKKIAFTGDFLLGDISPNPLIQRPWSVPVGYRSLNAYISSLQRVQALNLKAGFPGHGELIANPTERAASLLGQIETRRAAVLETFARQPWQTVYDVVKKVFPQLLPDHTFLAVSEVWAHLEVLLDQGVVKEESTMPVRFSLPGS